MLKYFFQGYADVLLLATGSDIRFTQLGAAYRSTIRASDQEVGETGEDDVAIRRAALRKTASSSFRR